MNVAMAVSEAMKYVLSQQFTNPNLRLTNIMALPFLSLNAIFNMLNICLLLVQ